MPHAGSPPPSLGGDGASAAAALLAINGEEMKGGRKKVGGKRRKRSFLLFFFMASLFSFTAGPSNQQVFIPFLVGEALLTVYPPQGRERTLLSPQMPSAAYGDGRTPDRTDMGLALAAVCPT